METKNTTQIILFLLGIGFVSFVIGYMVSGSASPVVGIAVPTIFGLIVTALGFISPFKDIKKANGESRENPSSDFGLIQEPISPEKIGIVLICFSLFFTLGIFIGNYHKITRFHVKEPPEFPWHGNEKIKPPTIGAALGWIALQRHLLELKYSDKQVAELYAIQIEEWKENTSISNFKPDDSDLIKSKSTGDEQKSNISESPISPFPIFLPVDKFRKNTPIKPLFSYNLPYDPSQLQFLPNYLDSQARNVEAGGEKIFKALD